MKKLLLVLLLLATPLLLAQTPDAQVRIQAPEQALPGETIDVAIETTISDVRVISLPTQTRVTWPDGTQTTLDTRSDEEGFYRAQLYTPQQGTYQVTATATIGEEEFQATHEVRVKRPKPNVTLQANKTHLFITGDQERTYELRVQQPRPGILTEASVMCSATCTTCAIECPIQDGIIYVTSQEDSWLLSAQEPTTRRVQPGQAINTTGWYEIRENSLASLPTSTVFTQDQQVIDEQNRIIQIEIDQDDTPYVQTQVAYDTQTGSWYARYEGNQTGALKLNHTVLDAWTLQGEPLNHTTSTIQATQPFEARIQSTNQPPTLPNVTQNTYGTRVDYQQPALLRLQATNAVSLQGPQASIPTHTDANNNTIYYAQQTHLRLQATLRNDTYRLEQTQEAIQLSPPPNTTRTRVLDEQLRSVFNQPEAITNWQPRLPAGKYFVLYTTPNQTLAEPLELLAPGVLISTQPNQTYQAQPNTQLALKRTIRNTDSQNPRTIDIQLESEYRVLLEDQAGNRLTDTNLNGVPDTGLLAPGEEFTLRAQALLPPEATNQAIRWRFFSEQQEINATDEILITAQQALTGQEDLALTRITPRPEAITVEFYNFHDQPLQATLQLEYRTAAGMDSSQHSINAPPGNSNETFRLPTNTTRVQAQVQLSDDNQENNQRTSYTTTRPGPAVLVSEQQGVTHENYRVRAQTPPGQFAASYPLANGSFQETPATLLREGELLIQTPLPARTDFLVALTPGEPLPLEAYDIIDNRDERVSTTGRWVEQSQVPGYYANNYLSDLDAGKGSKQVTYTPSTPGTYEVEVWHPGDAIFASNARVRIADSTILLNQRRPSEWSYLGRYELGPEQPVVLDNAASDGFVVADAIRLLRVDAYTQSLHVPSQEAQPSITASAQPSTQPRQGPVRLGEPVVWSQRVELASETTDVTVDVPAEASEVSVRAAGSNQSGRLTARSRAPALQVSAQGGGDRKEQVSFSLPAAAREVDVRYTTPPPSVAERAVSRVAKDVVISSDFPYKNVSSFSELPQPVSKQSQVEVVWLRNDSQQRVPHELVDSDGDGLFETVEWVTPHLSEQTFRIIVITEAQHLDNNRDFLTEVYDEVSELDGVWSPVIDDGEYVRVTFEKNLTSDKDITIYPRIVSGNPTIEVYERGENQRIATFSSLVSNDLNKVFLVGLDGKQDVFDLRVVNGSVEFDYIVDPTCVGGVCTQVFTASDTFTVPEGVNELDVLVVAGGGGGGSSETFSNAGGGGGGAGGLVYEENYSVTPLSTVTVTVGNGGAPGSGSNTPGINGQNSVFDTLTALGGGGGSGGNMQGLDGGSGGGSRGRVGGAETQTGSGSGGFGNRGGNHGGSPAGAAATGGGGAGSAAEDLAGSSGEKGGDGGVGLEYNITGTPTYYGGGGGGGAAQTNSPVGTGGLGGGGNGANDGTAATSGAANTGGGGGGGNNNRPGADGGSGIVVVRWDEPVSPESVRYVQRGSEDISTAVTDVSIDPVNTSASFVLLTVRSGSNNPDDLQVTGRLVDSSTLRLERYGTGAATVEWEVITDPDFTVQSGEESYAAGVSSDTVTIDAVDTSESFIIVTNRLDSTARAENIRGFWTGDFASSTSISLERATTGTAGVVSWQVVSIDGASVQSGSTTMAGGSTSESLSSVSLDDSLLVFSRRIDGVTHLAGTSVRGSLSDSTTLDFSRTDTTGNAYIEWFVIEWEDFNVQRGSRSVNGGSAVNQAISAVDALNQSFHWVSYDSTGTGDSFANRVLTSALTSTTNLQFIKGNGLQTQVVDWQVIGLEFSVVEAPTLHNVDGSNQIAFNNIRQNSVQPLFRASGIHTASFNRFQIELNTEPDFTGTAYTQTFSGSYSSGSQYNLLANSLSPSLPATDGVTYFVRARTSNDAGANWSNWSTDNSCCNTWTYTVDSVDDPYWFIQEQDQFDTQSLSIPSEFYTDTSPYTVGSSPPGWTQRWSTAGISFNVESVGAATGGQVLEMSSSSTARSMLSFDDLDGSTDVDIVTRHRFSDVANQIDYLFVRASGTAGSENNYAVIYLGGNIYLTERTAGAVSVLDSTAFTMSAGTWYRTRLQVTGTTIRMKIWADGDAEPGAWTLSATDSSHASGWVGVGGTNVRDTEFDIIGIGTGGDSGPLTPPSGSVRTDPVDFSYVPSAVTWGNAEWVSPGLTGSLYYSDTGICDALIPDSQISGNAAGLTSPVSIANLSTSTYGEICVNLSVGFNTNQPILDSVAITWDELPSLDPVNISFIPPTEVNNSYVNTSTVPINTSISSAIDSSGLIDFNRSLLLWLPFLNDSGATTKDYSTYDNEAKVEGGADWVSNGRFGGAYSFDNSSDNVINITPSPSMDSMEEEFTAMGWGYATAWTTPNHNPVVWRGTQIGWGANYHFRIAVSSGNPTWGVSCGGTEGFFEAGAVNLNEWYHYAITFDGDASRAYINGVEVGSDTACSGQQLNVPSEPVRVGWALRQTLSEVTRWTGEIDDIRLYNRALPQSEIRAAYNTSTYALDEQIAGLMDGFYEYYAAAINTDGAVNFTETRNITVDTTPPTITLNSPVEGFNSTPSVTLNWTTTDALSPVIECQVFVDGVLNASQNSTSAVPDTHTVNDLSLGAHNWSVTCTDLASWQVSSETRNFTVRGLANAMSPPNGTIIDRDAAGSDPQSANLIARIPGASAGTVINFTANLTDPLFAGEQELLLGQNTTNSSGHAVFTFNPDTTYYAGNYTWYAQSAVSFVNATATFRIHAGAAIQRSNSALDPLAAYNKSANVSLGFNITSLKESQLELANNYTLTTNVTLVHNATGTPSYTTALTFDGTDWIANQTIGTLDPVGPWRVVANTSGFFVYQNQSPEYYFDVFGFMNVSQSTLSAPSIFVYGSATQTCRVQDQGAGTVVAGANVSFYQNATLLGFNTTNATGYAQYSFQTNTTGDYNIRCLVSDQPSIYYYAGDAPNSTDSLSVLGFPITPISPVNDTLVDRDGVSATIDDTLTLNVSVPSGVPDGVSIAFFANRTDPTTASYTLGSNTTIAGHATITVPNASTLPGNYTWYAQATNGIRNGTRTYGVLGGYNVTFSSPTQDPNLTYEKPVNVTIDVTLVSLGAETQANLSLDYAAIANYSLILPNTTQLVRALTYTPNYVDEYEILLPGLRGVYGVQLNSSADYFLLNSASYREFLVNNIPPTHAAPILNTSSGNNYTNETLTAYNQSTFDVEGDAVKNLVSWRVDAQNYAVVQAPFEAISNSTYTQDYSGNAYHGTVTSATYNNTGGVDGFGAYEFDGANSEIEFGNLAEVNGATQLSGSAWIRVNDLTKDNDIFSKGAHGANVPLLFWRDDSGNEFGRDNMLAILISDGSTDARAETATDTLNNNSWVHVAFTFEANSPTGLRLYINGVEDANNPVSTVGITAIDSNTEQFTVGRPATGGGAQAFDGSIDEVYLFNRTISPEQVYVLYERGLDLSLDERIVSQETSAEEVWQACITPVDTQEAGTQLCSNTLRVEEMFAPSNLTISDDSDFQTKRAYQQHTFFANYSDAGGVAINTPNSTCEVRLNTTGTYGNYTSMSFNSSQQLYTYTSDFVTPGAFTYNVFCDEETFASQNATDTFVVNTSAVNSLTPLNTTIIDRDNSSFANESARLTLNLPNAVAGVNVTFAVDLLDPAFNSSTNLTLGTNLTLAGGNVSLVFNPPSSFFAGRYRYYGYASAAVANETKSVDVYGSLQANFSSLTTNPNAQYNQSEVVFINASAHTPGPENASLLAANYTAQYNASILLPNSSTQLLTLDTNTSWFEANYSLSPTHTAGVHQTALNLSAQYFFLVSSQARNFTVFGLSNAVVFDEQDMDNLTRLVDQPLRHYVNWTDQVGAPITTGTCTLTSWNNSVKNMSYQPSSELWVANYTYPFAGIFRYNATCQRPFYYNVSGVNNLTITSNVSLVAEYLTQEVSDSVVALNLSVRNLQNFTQRNVSLYTVVSSLQTPSYQLSPSVTQPVAGARSGEVAEWFFTNLTGLEERVVQLNLTGAGDWSTDYVVGVRSPARSDEVFG